MPTVASKLDFLVGRDQVSKRFDKMGRRADKFGRKGKRSFDLLSKSALSAKSVMSGVIGANVLTRGTQLLAQGIGVATREFVDFDQALTVASAKFPEKIKRGSLAFKELQAAARKVGAETQFTATQSAEGLALFAAAGIDAKVSMAALNGVVDLATATSVEFADATETALSTMGQFGLKTKDAAKFASNLDRVSDALVHTVNSAQLQMEDLSETLKFVGPIANTAGAEIEEVNAIIAAMAESGIKGSLAGTALKNMYLRLLEPTPKISKELKRLKINLEDDNGEMQKLTDIIGQLEGSLGGLTKKQKATSLSILFGKRAVSGAAAAMEIGSEKIAKFEEQMRKAGGVSKDTADDIRKGLGNQLKILQSTAIEAGFRFLEAFDKQGEGAIQKLTEAIRQFDMRPIVAGVQEFIRIIKVGIQFVKDYDNTIKAAIKILVGVGGMVLAIKAIGVALMGVQAIISLGPLGGLLIAVGAVTTAIVIMNDRLEQSIEAQRRLQALEFAKEGMEEALLIRNQILSTSNDDIRKHIELRKDMIVELKKVARNQDLAGKSTRKTTERMKALNEQIDRLKTAESNLFGQNVFGIPSMANRLQPSVFTGEEGVAPNAAEVEGKNNRAQLDVNFQNAPPGTTAKARGGKGAPRIDHNLAGANP